MKFQPTADKDAIRVRLVDGSLTTLVDKVVSKGIIAFDDYESWPGVTQAVDESIARGELRKVEQAKSLLITEKT